MYYASATDARGRWLRSARGPAWRVLGELQEKMPRRARGESEWWNAPAAGSPRSLSSPCYSRLPSSGTFAYYTSAVARSSRALPGARYTSIQDIQVYNCMMIRDRTLIKHTHTAATACLSPAERLGGREGPAHRGGGARAHRRPGA